MTDLDRPHPPKLKISLKLKAVIASTSTTPAPTPKFIFPITIAIIGSASDYRGPFSLTRAIWEHLCALAEGDINKITEGDWSRAMLVSGGAAWCDHIAVALYLKHPESRLHLHFPCRWDAAAVQFTDTKQSTHWQQNPGSLANKLHRVFSQRIGIPTLQQVQQAIDKGADIKDNYKGFHDRNKAVAQCQYMIAFSYNQGTEPSDGGTAHTWNLAKASKRIYHPITQSP